MFPTTTHTEREPYSNTQNINGRNVWYIKQWLPTIYRTDYTLHRYILECGHSHTEIDCPLGVNDMVYCELGC